MKVAGFSTAGPRPANEDSYYVLDFSDVQSFSEGISAFIMVSDGMGGHDGGDVASRLAVQAAETYLQQLLAMAEEHQVELDVPLAFKEIVENANEAIGCEMQVRGNTGMGATFVGAFLSSRKAWVAHVGDSRAYLIHRGAARQLTKDHSAVGRLLSEGLITERQAQEHPERNVIERALGFTDGDPEITEVTLARGDALLLCSDGVSTVLDAQMLADSVMRAASVEATAEDVVALALKRNTDDNATAVVAVANWSSLKASAPREGLLGRFRRGSAPRPASGRANRPSRRRPAGGTPPFDHGASPRSGHGMPPRGRRPNRAAVLLIVLLALVVVLAAAFAAGFLFGGGLESPPPAVEPPIEAESLNV
ncbi:MAG: serine/threonine-protein phosphatase [Coriobacteriales bacterium]|jgi:protein phosphatase|nr:serine/threonine-protein phosphatase [Coriobacteriales bacterium]